MQGVHFLDPNGLDFVGLSKEFQTRCCAKLPLPGDFVRLEQELDRDSSMNKLPFEERMLVQDKDLFVKDIWITVDRWGDDVRRYEYSFEGIPGRFRGDAFIDARWTERRFGALLSVDGNLWWVITSDTRLTKPKKFGEAFPVTSLGRTLRHELFGSFRLDESDGEVYADSLRHFDIEPIFGVGEFAEMDKGPMLLSMTYPDKHPDLVPQLEEAVSNVQLAPTP